MRLSLCLAVTAGAALLAGAAHAKPEYAQKENKNCAYCHIDPAGGGPRNPRGIYYQMHNYSFEGYDEEKVMGAKPKKTGPPAFKSAWTLPVKENTTRIFVADVTGDRTPRLLTLGSDHNLAVHKVGENGAQVEATIALGDKSRQIAVGHFAKGKPAVIVVPGAIHYRDGDKYAKKETTDVSDITGQVRFADGEECFFFFAGGVPDVWSVDLSAEKPITYGRELVPPDQGAGLYSFLTVHIAPEFMSALGLPEQAQKTGFAAGFDPRADKNLYALLTWQDNDGPAMVVADISALALGGGGEVKPIWRSPKLAGKVLDVALGTDPRGSKQTGFFVLMETADGKGRQVEFFALD